LGFNNKNAKPYV
jgi:hypothetical protein